AAWAPVRSVLVQRAAGKHIPVFIGADHHAAHPDVPQLRDLLAELDPQSAFRVSRLDEFFQAAADAAKPAPVAGGPRWSYRYARSFAAACTTSCVMTRTRPVTRAGRPLPPRHLSCGIQRPVPVAAS